MYRLCKLRTLPVTNVNVSTNPMYIRSSSHLCSFCKFYHTEIPKLTYQQLRSYSTTINPSQKTNLFKNNSKRKSANYVELLEVTDSVTKDGKTKVKKLNAANLSKLVNSVDTIKSKSNSVKNSLIENINLAKNRQNHELQLKKEEKNLSSPKKPELTTKSQDTEQNEKTQKPKKTKKVKKEKLSEENITNSEMNLNKILAASEKHHLNLLEQKSKKVKSLKQTNKLFNSLKSKKEIKFGSNLESFCEEVNPEEFEDDLNDEILIRGNQSETRKQFQSITEENFKYLMFQENRLYNLLSYFEIHAKKGNLDHCYFVFKNLGYVRMKLTGQHISIYNFFLKEFASRGDLTNVKNILKLIEKDSSKMTLASYAYVLEGIGRTENPSKEIKFLTSLKHQMDENNITLNKVVTSPTFVKDQLEKILLSVRLLDPNFRPFFKKINTNYNCHLLKNVFDNRSPESPAKGIFSISDLEERMQNQLKIENQGQIVIKSVVNNELSPQNLIAREKWAKLLEKWREDIRIAFERNIKVLGARKKKINISELYVYLTVLNKEEYVDAIIRDVKILAETAESFSPPLNYLTKELGQRLFLKYEMKVHQDLGLSDKTLESYRKYCKWYLEGGRGENGRIKWQLLEEELKEKGYSMNTRVVEWPLSIMRSIGASLYDIILKDLKINIVNNKGKETSVPAFYAIFRSKYRQSKEEIKPHPFLTKLFRDTKSDTLVFDATLVPTLIPPRPWSSHKRGGYLITKTNMIRIPFGAVAQWKKLNEIPPKQIYSSLDCLNQLGSIPWRVNTSILEVAIEVFRKGGSKKLDVPESPSILPAPPLLTEDLTDEERKEILRKRMELRRRKNEMHSLWCDALYKLSLANHYRDDIFWLPHNMDFRGRVYPIPPHLSQMGSDFARSMLVFAQKKPLGPKGLDWLKIHVINLTGFMKKESIERRLEYANEILDDILDSAEKPLTGKMWWTTSDEPWQTLSGCIEISKALKFPNPAEYLTGFPVHQDGSCNGLQHYAALGRDQSGAESVNLYPFEKPRDVYSDIVQLVEKARIADANNGEIIAKILEGHIQRKVIKQTIMTTVYGVTKFGARLQIAKQLKAIDNFPEDKIWEASLYLVKKTFESLRTMFKSAKEIQDWFIDCAKNICTVRQESVEWVTPLGLPIIQPYTKHYVGTKYQPMDNYEKPNAMKQKNAFPPNFIHSLDSTHMMLTSLHCEQAGITFMSVHDCFWTHPCTVEKMNEICRKQFIALHSTQILENLSQFLVNRYSFSESELKEDSINNKMYEARKNLNEVLVRVPAKGTFDLEKVQSSAYFFS